MLLNFKGTSKYSCHIDYRLAYMGHHHFQDMNDGNTVRRHGVRVIC